MTRIDLNTLITQNVGWLKEKAVENFRNCLNVDLTGTFWLNKFNLDFSLPAFVPNCAYAGFSIVFLKISRFKRVSFCVNCIVGRAM